MSHNVYMNKPSPMNQWTNVKVIKNEHMFEQEIDIGKDYVKAIFVGFL